MTPDTGVHLTTEGKALAEEIWKLYQAGESVEDIAERFEIQVQHVQFLMTVQALAMKKNACLNHRPIQHRDGKPPWCRQCGEADAY